MRVRALARSIYRRIPRPPSTNFNLRQLRVNPYELLPHGASVLDLGSKSVKGQYAFGSPPDHVSVTTVDLCAGPNVDVIADAHHLPFGEDAFDAVWCVSVLEHVEDPSAVLAQIARVLKPGGLVYINAPFVFPYHADPADYHRFTRQGIQVLCRPFEPIQVGFNRGPASTFCHLAVHFFAMVFCFNCKWLYGVLVDFFQWCFFWVKYLDRWISRSDTLQVLYSGTFFLGRKPARPSC